MTIWLDYKCLRQRGYGRWQSLMMIFYHWLEKGKVD